MDASISDSALAHLNLEDDAEVALLAAALDCLPVDIFNAVAAVGDRIIDIRDYVWSTLRCKSGGRRCRSVRATDDLPPLWPEEESGRIH